MNTTTLEIGQTLAISGQAVVVESIKGRWVKLADGRNISRADAAAARQAYLDAQAARESKLDDKEIADWNNGKATPEAPDTVEDIADATGYTGPMLALRDRAKQGLYKKAANGQPSCGDEVATILGALKPQFVIRACVIALNLEANPYTHLNVGQQSMNLRNKLRGALIRGEFGMGVVREAADDAMAEQAAAATTAE
ncbi:hypothetical protein UFOVP580_34 [uncultured Caudovirales phage]|uniref:Uncharacterized protein n=1 Tax=uncultured Caudovirales phage TaxID=2100421 RepID=A0A6J5PA45_9CAUD|nr:hypothetical protein UFOVP580_34 [uncultured Caudovirales phage]